ncbi:MAG TPA: HPr family phosphocarrier protein [Devosiaceae bacterium]
MNETDFNTGRAVAQRLTICNQRGLHARASARFVRTAEHFDAEVTVTRDGTTVGGTSIMGLMMLAAGPGSTILVKATGRQAREALEAIANLVNSGFDEDNDGMAD